MRKFVREFLSEKPLFFSFLRPKEASLYQEFRPFKKPILDLGCGDGFFAQLAFEKIDVGIDPDKSAVLEAKSRDIYSEMKPYNGKKIPYTNNYFATIVCNSTFEHITNIDEVLKETARVLQKGGMLYFTVPTDTWPKYLFGQKLLGKRYQDFFVAKSKHYNLYSISKWQQKLKALGLEVTQYTHYLDNPKIMELFDISHYLSVSSLLTKKLFNKWVLFPSKMKYVKQLEEYILEETKANTSNGPYLFIAARKK